MPEKIHPDLLYRHDATEQVWTKLREGMVGNKMILFTNPPTGIEYPYILLNVFNWRRENVRLRLRRKYWSMILVDCAVDQWFFLSKLKDYPEKYLDSYAYVAQNLAMKWKNSMITIPDYPDDYTPGQTHTVDMDNVDKTFLNIDRFSKVPGPNWLFPLQSRFLDVESFHKACGRLMKYEPCRIGIGTVCKTNHLDFIKECCKIARDYFPKAWIHAFGPTLKALRHIHQFIDSCDSTAYFMKPNPSLEGQRMCRTQQERREYFRYWIEKANREVAN